MTVSTRTMFKQVPLFASYRRLLGRYLRPQKTRALIMSILLVGGIAAQLASPQIIRYFLDTAQAGSPLNVLINTALLYIGFALLQQAFGLAAAYNGQKVAWTATNCLRTDLTIHCLKLDMGFHKRHTPGEMIERIEGDVSHLGNFFSELVIQVISNGLLILGILILLYYENIQVGLGMTAYALLTLAALGSIQKLATTRWSVTRQLIAQQNGFLEERVTGIEDIQVNGAQEYTLQRLLDYLREILNKMRIALVISQLGYNLTRLLYVLGFAIGLSLGVYLFRQGEATVGAAYLIVNYVAMLSTPLQNIRRQEQDLQQAGASVQRVEELFEIRPLVSDPEETLTAHEAKHGLNGALSVSFENVTFTYEDGKYETTSENLDQTISDAVLKNISFDLEAGKVLGILGRTGSGKTTLTRLLFRLYDPISGCIRLNGQNLRFLPVSQIRRSVGLVTQDVQLFEASVRDNLTFFNHAISKEHIHTILDSLGLIDWVEGLPQGLDTRLGAGGQGLSAGEAQLLAFARVFLKEPGLIVLDEASSRLDPVTENRMERAIDRLFTGRTGVIIAHRLHTVERADVILILENGRAAEFGPRQELAAQPNSRYAQLLRTGLEEVMA